MRFKKKYTFIRVIHDIAEFAVILNNETGKEFTIPYDTYKLRKQYFDTTLYMLVGEDD